MAVTEVVQEFLRQANVAYSVFPHAPAFTAQEEAAVTHISGRDWAKPVLEEMHSKNRDISTDAFLAMERSIVAAADAYRRAITLAVRGAVDLSWSTSHRFPLDDAPEAFATAARREGLKVVVDLSA